ncbi:hypothetical protein RHSIM_Rhsim09G0020200 [Rhododendron simsii]|uniref:Aminotransferase-like plant mobile domain-containing protein n=1 Tax=Rhododendron simsii TaxID=118357 RepID=A0A834LFD3_RHOSS|nr:hypothetical protein RHSIM_Rhsim09G0020200 [Rhododendron simsii]
MYYSDDGVQAGAMLWDKSSENVEVGFSRPHRLRRRCVGNVAGRSVGGVAGVAVVAAAEATGVEEKHIHTHFHLEVAQQWTLKDNDPRLKYIEKSNFGWVRKLESFKCNIDLLKLLYSRFMPETSTFLLCGTKYMISIEDVASLTGLCIDGDAIVWKEEKNVSALCKNFLGKEPHKAARGAINYSWLLTTFGTLENEATTEQIIVSARAYILFILAMLALLIDNLKKEPSKKGVVTLARSAALLEAGGNFYRKWISPLDGAMKQGYRQKVKEYSPTECGDAGPENDEEMPKSEVESPRMEESPNQPENEEERESKIIEGERNEEETEPQQVARLHKRARKQMPEGIIPQRSTRLQNKGKNVGSNLLPS